MKTLSARLAAAFVLAGSIITGAVVLTPTETSAQTRSQAKVKTKAPVPARSTPWMGNYEIMRNDPRLTTLGAQRTLVIQIMASDDAGHREVSWHAERGICPDISAPCEWLGETGLTTRATVVNGLLIVALNISAEIEDPHILVLQPPTRPNGVSSGALVTAKGDTRMAVSAIKEP
jgi:hypothetical protein